jgi:cobyrinic acid a,c-diamide synthase
MVHQNLTCHNFHLSESERERQTDKEGVNKKDQKGIEKEES